MSVHALELNAKIIEKKIKYYKRPENSYSKLNTFSDGLSILSRIVTMLIDSRPIYLFSTLSLFYYLVHVFYYFQY